MKKILLFALFVLIGQISWSQLLLKPGYYAVFFRDKQGTTASLDSPQTFLSPRAIERRKHFNIPITEQDLPVSQVYLDSLKKYGFQIWEKSKWLNGVVLKIDDSTQLALLDSLVNAWDFLLPNYNHLIVPKDSGKVHFYVDSALVARFPKDTALAPVYDYGLAEVQNNLVNIPELHSLGYQGQGVVMALLDAGFWNANKIKAFKHLFDGDTTNGEVLGYYDFVHQDTNVFDAAAHGTMALSTIAANDSGNMVGTAPKASFYLFRTEDENSEYKIEEFNWAVGAETADSLGVDEISSSLGYTTFDDSTMNYTYKDLNGNTAISTIAADIAASKGIIVVISAGNEGDNPWHFVSVPADGDSVVAVGAVISFPPYSVASFSSRGPTYDGRIKPDVAAVGLFTSVVNQRGKTTISAGTSFSGPTVAGVLACLRGAYPNIGNMDIVKALKMSGSTAFHPNFNVGYGIPNAYLAYEILKHWDEIKPLVDKQ